MGREDPLFSKAMCSEGGYLGVILQSEEDQHGFYYRRVVLSCMVWNMRMAVILIMMAILAENEV